MSADYEEDYLMHYGVSKLDGAPGRGSGRYALGSGQDPYQHTGDFISRVDELRRANVPFVDENGRIFYGDTAVAKHLGLTSSQFRVNIALARQERRKADVATAKSLQAQGKNPTEIARIMGYSSESSVRSLLNEKSEARMNQAQATADILKQQIDKYGKIEVGAGVERQLGVSREKLQQALDILELQGYPHFSGRVPQATNPGKQTTFTVVGPPGTEHKDIYNYGEIHSATDFTSDDGGVTFRPSFVYPKSLDSSRLKINYATEDGKGGALKDGLIEIRRGVEDLNIGGHYAQVRILVDGDRYLKGMAVYSDNLPDGIDILFNTNKTADVPMRDVLKKIKTNPDGTPAENPFGSLIKEVGGQSYYTDKDGNQQLSLINKRGQEGDWGEWKDKLPSQFLAKQPMKLVNQQLNLAATEKYQEFDEICALTNPTVKKRLLESFADDCDSAAVHLQAAALPRQKYQVILPLTSIKDNEVYAPNYRDGETVALIRYPHGGTFEIPILKVNNKNKEGIEMISKNPKDAVGINAAVASRLSGADFDGDTVMVIPCNSSSSNVRITSTHPLKGLVGFDPKDIYGGKEEGTFRPMKNTQNEMGKISNLITDMTIMGAPEEELEKAVRHSMVVIDAEKHGLDYKQSEKDNDIKALKRKWQGHYNEDGSFSTGAATLISRAKSPKDVPKRRGSPKINPETGELIWNEVYETYTDKNGKTKQRMQRSTKMAEVKDARELSSGTPVEEAYADYANKMKSLANQARKELKATGKIEYSPEAKAKYQREVDSLTSQLNEALKNSPKERMAQLVTSSSVSSKKKDNPDMTKEEVRKLSQQTLTRARAQMGAKRTTIDISDREWEAIQAGAISETRLAQILDNTDIDAIRERATPRSKPGTTDAQIARMKAMAKSGYTNEEIAERFNVSASYVSKLL